MHHYHHYHLRRHYHRRRHGRRRRRVFYVAFQKAEDPKIVPHAFQAVKAQALNIKLEITEKVKILYIFLPRNAMRKRGLCCGPVSVRLSVCLSRSCILSKR